MALERRVVSINFVSGLDQKTDPKLTTKLTTADNVVLRKNGTIEKRPGFVANGSFTSSLSTANPVRVFPFHNGEFVVTDYNTDALRESGIIKPGGVTVSYTSQYYNHAVARVGDYWVKQGVASTFSMRTRTLLADTGSVTSVDIALAGVSATSEGVVISAVLGSGSVTCAYIYDVSTETKSNVLGLNADAVNRMRLVNTAVSSVTAYGVGMISSVTWIQFLKIQAQGTGIAPALVTGSDTGANPQLDAVAFNDKVYFAARHASLTGIIVGWFDPSNSTTSTTVINGGTQDMITIATPNAGTDRIRVIWMKNNASNTALYATFSATLSLIQSATTITVGVAGYGNGLITQIGAVESNTNAGIYLAFTQSSTTTLPLYTAWQEYDNAGVLQTQAGFSLTNIYTNNVGLKSCQLIAKPFLAHGVPTAVLCHSATGQQSVVVTQAMSGRMYAVGRCLFGLAGGNASTSYAWLPNVQQATNDVFYTVVRKGNAFRSGPISSTTVGFVVNYGAEVVRMDFSQTQSIPFAQIGDATYMGGGFLSEYDSSGILESGFLSSPVIASVSTTTSGGSAGSATGSYSVVILKEFTDQAGRVHRGQPSLPVTFTTSTTTSQATAVFSDGPNLGTIIGRGGQIKYSAFRTTNNGTIYYRDVGTSLTGGTAVSITALSLSMTSSDSALSSGDVIYTQGGSLPNYTPDSVAALCAHKNRLFCDDPTDNGKALYSKEVIPGEGVAFAQANQILVPGHGRISALASLDSVLVAFRERSIFIVSGEGPDDTGQNGSFSDGQLLFSDVGCINQRNVCRFRDGIIFKSPDKGFYMLSRDLQLQFIGADVENYNSKTVVSSEVVALTEASGVVEECRFLCSDGTLLTYNYYNGQWTTATLAGCTDAVQTGGRYVVVNPTSTAVAGTRVFQQSMTTYTDAFSNTSTTYQMTVETGFVKTADVQGFQRVYKVQGLGESMGGGRISVEVGYDYETAYNETYTFSMSSMTTPNYTGGAASAPQFDFVPVRQKCQAIRFRIKDYPTENGAVMKITNLSLECGVKSGVFKLPAAKGA